VKRLPPIVALVAAAGLLVAVVVGLAALAFDPVTDEAVPLVPISVDGEMDSPPMDPGALAVTGDVEATVHSGDFTIETDPESGSYIHHLQAGGLDFFLHPEDCDLAPGEVDPATAMVPVTVECTGVSDIRDTVTVDLTGAVEVPFGEVAPPGVTLGAELVVTGDIDATLELGPPLWWVRPGQTDPDFPEPELQAFALTPDEFYSLNLDRDEDGSLYATFFTFQRYTFEPPTGACSVTEQLVETTGPHTAVYTVDVDCPSITALEGDTTISLHGQITGHRLDGTAG
jgi:hypothetical protein